ncbi:alpha/beta-hydrolase [Protomyces lactucae-debilis]|uniref:Alpha/beta-hydrolase n=1 Tax=Protomyces lactucae-debilis TaxID=2754530 RepID=A0A1Y2FKH0_PROLT|nr:alpha/beta-hydrolase [Protomyces lactucae-debilis]ORY84482.1 alpha/beta-hydrolase [Protomyces lactucae-debilis]
MTQLDLHVPARAISPSQHLQPEAPYETYSIPPALQVEERFFKCPVSHDNPNGPHLDVFVRICRSLARSHTSATTTQPKQESPYILFLQGGPGFECSSSTPAYAGVLKVLIDRGYTVLYLDQRGTGLSTCLTAELLAKQGSLAHQVEFCKHFRADSIVKDCELIRKHLTSDRQEKRWTLLGQSFGGFCELTYLSFFPEALQAVINTGGMAPVLDVAPMPVYERIINKIKQANEEYYAKFPQDVVRVRHIHQFLVRHAPKTPNGGTLTCNRFRQLGLDLGMHGGYNRLHNLVFRAHTDIVQSGMLGYRTLEMIEAAASYDSVPIYSVLHESIYCQEPGATDWAAAKVFQAQLSRLDHYFIGEIILPTMFDDYAGLRPFKDVAFELAKRQDWTPLYNLEQLQKNRVPIVTAIYIDDMFVHLDAGLATAKHIGNCKELITNRWLHNALRHEPHELLGYLFGLLQEF